MIEISITRSGTGRTGSVGQLSGGCEVRLVDPTGRDVPRGQTGELWTRPSADEGKHPEYYREPEATAAVVVDDWFHTGDLLREDEDGWWYFVGRGSDSLRQRGENIVPEDVERAVMTIAEVADAAGDGAAVTNAVGDAMLGMEDACTTLAAEMTSQVIPQGRKTARDEARGRHPGMGDPETDDEPPATNRRLA